MRWPFSINRNLHTNTKNAFLLLGSNMGDRFSLLQQAFAMITKHTGPAIRQSALYESEPWGFEAATRFLNQAVLIETQLPPMQLLHTLQRIEQQLGRTPATTSGEYVSRPIDIDILFYENTIIHTKSLTIPHPLLHERRFTLLPLCDIAPDYTHPVLQQTLAQLLKQCRDHGTVEKIV